MAYFVIKDFSRAKGVSIKGQLIVDAVVELDNDDKEATAQSKPAPKIPKLHELKWILPPRGSKSYGAVKAFAEIMGYETVEHDDFTYPERPFG